MIPYNELITKLGYDSSPHYWLASETREPETAHLFRSASEAAVDGIYVFEASPSKEKKVLSSRPAVYLAEAKSIEEARSIHRKLWNLSYAPFIIIRLPNQIRVYTGFNYSEEPEIKEEGLLDEIDNVDQLANLLDVFSAAAIDTGRIWQSNYAKELNTNHRVDKRLLKNLEQLGAALRSDNLRDKVGHALIGKYVYLSYLRGRKVLTDKWLRNQKINEKDVFGPQATVKGLRALTEALARRVNGKIFPIDFDEETSLIDKHVSWVASVFSGSEISEDAPQKVRQLCFPFRAYDFNYIPVETFSSIYEQFIHEKKKKGAIYTPEVLADYLLSEIEWAASDKPLKRGVKICDPACGSGVFLVLAYRRLIEKEMSRRGGRKLSVDELKAILLESIYGVERELAACYVTEFSLILTLLHYSEPRELEKLKFQFPDLHNKQIFHCDFFDLEGEESEVKFWHLGLKFDWIVGNPPWIQLREKKVKEANKFVYKWITQEGPLSERPVCDNRTAEAFSWLVTDLLNVDGIVGLVLPATSLFNLKSKKYRKKFFTDFEVMRVTNFANIRTVLFDKRSGDYPAFTIVYRQTKENREKANIVHYGPFAINQLSESKNSPWVITINENEIQTIDHHDAEQGETSLWKFALWGNSIDERAIERIKYLFQADLKTICETMSWSFCQGAELRIGQKKSTKELEYIKKIGDKKRFDTDSMSKSFCNLSIDQEVLKEIPDEMCHIRKRGGKAGLKLTNAPHIILSPVWMSYVVYSDEDFSIPSRQIGIAGKKSDSKCLRALSVYLKSSLVSYYLFFNSQQWGVFRHARLVSIAEVRKIPTPKLTQEEIEELATFHQELIEEEKQELSSFVSYEGTQREIDFKNVSEKEKVLKLEEKLPVDEKKKIKEFIAKLRGKLQRKIDKKIYVLFKIPNDIQILVDEFIKYRLPLDTPAAIPSVIRKPSKDEMFAYAQELKRALDDFAMNEAYHSVDMFCSDEITECVIEVKGSNKPRTKVDVKESDLTRSKVLAELSGELREQFSQWVYVQRGLRLFDESKAKVHIYKEPRLINWTRTQAMVDASDIIGEILDRGGEHSEII